MEQNRQQPQKPLSSRRATWFVSALLALLLLSAVLVAQTSLENARNAIMTKLEHSLALPVQDRSSSLAIWYSGLTAEIERYTQSDMFRLHAAEVQDLGDRVEEMIRLARDPLMSPGDSSNPARLASQLSLLRSQLEQLVDRSDLLSVTLMTPELKPYLGTGVVSPEDPIWQERLTDDAWNVASRIMAAGQVQVSPVRRKGNDHLTMVLGFPLFAPEYLSRPEDRDPAPVGLMLLTCDVTPIIERMTIRRGLELDDQAGFVLQLVNDRLELLVPEGDAAPFVLPGWQPDGFGDLPFAAYGTPEGNMVYALGLAVQGLPWLVAQDEQVSAVEARYEQTRRNVLLTVGACTAIVLSLVGMFWWWFVGRRDRALAGELKQLYNTVNRQHQLLRGINSSVADGIMMLNREGIVQYANEAFGAMAGKRAEDVIGHSLYESFGKNTAERIVRVAGQVLRQNAQGAFTEDLPLAAGRRHYQIVCSPFHQDDGRVTGVVGVFRDMTDLVKAQRHAQTMIHQTVTVLVRAIEAVDPYLRGQSFHTGRLAAQLAQLMGLDTAHVSTVRTAASLSQIGMIQLPRDLVNKTSILTAEERQELERHVEYARKTLEGIDFGLPIQEAIYEMHEHMDGSGYPRGLKGDAIDLNARLLAVANTFCALLRPRSYRHEHSVAQALDILSETPPKYDPAIVQVLRDYLKTSQGQEFLDALQRKED